jgi:hypothetical protein
LTSHVQTHTFNSVLSCSSFFLSPPFDFENIMHSNAS